MVIIFDLKFGHYLDTIAQTLWVLYVDLQNTSHSYHIEVQSFNMSGSTTVFQLRSLYKEAKSLIEDKLLRMLEDSFDINSSEITDLNSSYEFVRFPNGGCAANTVPIDPPDNPTRTYPLLWLLIFVLLTAFVLCVIASILVYLRLNYKCCFKRFKVKEKANKSSEITEPQKDYAQIAMVMITRNESIPRYPSIPIQNGYDLSTRPRLSINTSSRSQTDASSKTAASSSTGSMLPEIAKFHQSVQLIELIGRGSFGKVWKATWNLGHSIKRQSQVKCHFFGKVSHLGD